MFKLFLLDYIVVGKKHIVPTGLFSNIYFAFYQYIVPNGTVPEGLDTGRIISTPICLSPVGTECVFV
jgi:hypothetical protein